LFKKLKILTNDNQLQQLRIDSLKFLVGERFSIFPLSLYQFRHSGYLITDSLRNLAYRAKFLMSEIRKMGQQIKKVESRVIIEKNQNVSSFSEFTKIISIFSLIIAILLTFYSLDKFNRSNKARQQADKNAEEFREQLELRVAELNKLNTELVELKSIEKFAVTGRISRTIAHEVRNPLTNINLATEHLRSEISPGAETDILLDMITRNSNRINQLISDLLNSTKVSHLDYQKISINDLLDTSLEFAQDRIELKGIKVIKNYALNGCDISVDIQKMNIAFLNILVNAVESMEPNTGILNIKTEQTKDHCIAVISDNGKGMNEEEVTRLFEPYFTTKENGTGLGLTNTQNIILSHKAKIKAQSIPGKGTSFIISLPL
jgi:signal transduction histidine kinase